MRTAAILLLLVTPTFAGNCPKVFVQQHKAAVILQQAYVPQYYQVGAQVQQEAVIEAAVSRALARFQATVTTEKVTTTATLGANAQATVQVQGGFRLTKCASCHDAASANVKAREAFLLTAELTCEQRIAAIGAMMRDEHRMPLNGALTAEELGDYIGWLSGVKK